MIATNERSNCDGERRLHHFLFNCPKLPIRAGFGKFEIGNIFSKIMKVENSLEQEKNPLEKLRALGAVVEPDRMNKDALVIKFPFENGVSTLRVLFKDVSGADMVITNITTLPDSSETKGYGSEALQKVLAWAKENNLLNIKAVQVQKESEGFWEKNGFTKDEGENVCNDFTYRGMERAG